MIKKEYSNQEEVIARFAKALGHPARITILSFLASRSTCYFGEFLEIIPLSKATISQHLSELKDAGLIQGQFEPPKVRYCIDKENWKLAQMLFADFFNNLTSKEAKCCE